MAHNGGRSQGVLYFPSSGQDDAYINRLKRASGWSGSPAPTDLNDQGYPVSGSRTIAMGIPTQAQFPGNWCVRWDGNHNITVSGATTVSGSTTGGAGGGLYVFSTVSSTISLGVTAITTPSTLIEVFNVNQQTQLDAGQIFTDVFLNRLRTANFGVLRFLDWTYTNISNAALWDYRKPVDYCYYDGDQFRSDLYAGTTTNSGDDYSVSFTGFSLVDKATVMVLFNANATGTAPTLNVESTGAKVIKGPYSDTLFSTQKPTTAGGTATLVYDADLDCWIKQGGCTDRANSGLVNGVPLEIILALCNEVGAHPWVHVPFLALDPLTDYTSELATYFRDNLDSGLVPRFEPANEVWNSATGFYATRYGWNKANDSWGTSFDQNGWYGRALSRMGEAVSGVYGDDRSRYQVICGVGTHVSPPSSANDRLLSTRYVVDGGTPASDWATHVAPTNYFSPPATKALFDQELALAYAYDNGDTTAPATLLDNAMLSLAFGNAYVKTVLVTWKSWADGFGLGLCFYEGGYSPDYPTSNLSSSSSNQATSATKAAQAVITLHSGSVVPVAGMTVTASSFLGMTELNGNTYTVVSVAGQAVTLDVDSTGFGTHTSPSGVLTYVNSQTWRTALRTASKDVPALYGYLLQNYNDCLEIGGEFPSCYNISGHDNAWSVLDPDIYATPDPPQWLAIVDFNNPDESEQPEVRPQIINQAAGTQTFPVRRRAVYETYDTIARRAKIAEIEELKTAILARGVIAPKVAEKVQEFVPYMDTTNVRTLVAELARVQQELEDEDEAMMVLAFLH